jgi:DNA-binding MarR family transcriptional regulator
MSLHEFQGMPGHLIRRLQQIAVALFIAENDELDLTPIQYASLMVIREVPDLDATRLSTLAALDRATLANVLERLESKGWIVRSGSKEDKRVKLLRITPKGRAILKAAEPGVRRCQRKILEPLAAADQVKFMKMLGRLVEINNDYSRAPAGGRAAAAAKKKSRKPAVAARD